MREEEIETLARRTLAGENTDLLPNPSIRHDIHAVMRAARAERNQRTGFLDRIVGYRVPAWQAAFAVTAAMAVMWIIARQPSSAPAEHIVYLHVADTANQPAIDTDAIAARVVDSIRDELRREIAAEVPTRVAYRSRENKKTRNAGSVEPDASAPNEPSTQSPTPNRFVGLANLPQLDVQKRGRSVAEDSSLWKFRTTMVRDTF